MATVVQARNARVNSRSEGMVAGGAVDSFSVQPQRRHMFDEQQVAVKPEKSKERDEAALSAPLAEAKQSTQLALSQERAAGRSVLGAKATGEARAPMAGPPAGAVMTAGAPQQLPKLSKPRTTNDRGSDMPQDAGAQAQAKLGRGLAEPAAAGKPMQGRQEVTALAKKKAAVDFGFEAAGRPGAVGDKKLEQEQLNEAKGKDMKGDAGPKKEAAVELHDHGAAIADAGRKAGRRPRRGPAGKTARRRRRGIRTDRRKCLFGRLERAPVDVFDRRRYGKLHHDSPVSQSGPGPASAPGRRSHRRDAQLFPLS